MGKNPGAKKNRKSKFVEKRYEYNLEELQDEAAVRGVDLTKIEKILRKEAGEDVSSSEDE